MNAHKNARTCPLSRAERKPDSSWSIEVRDGIRAFDTAGHTKTYGLGFRVINRAG